MVMPIARPKLEGNVAVGDDRQIGFAEFGDPQGRAVFWLHGTPGARRQIPTEARDYAENRHVRLIGVDRPGIGSSTSFQYRNVLEFADDLRTIADVVVFARDWGFRLDEVKVPVLWWHGDRDHIVPFEHGQHVVSRLPDAELYHLPGESHLAGLGRAEEILSNVMASWDRLEKR